MATQLVGRTHLHATKPVAGFATEGGRRAVVIDHQSTRRQTTVQSGAGGIGQHQGPRRNNRIAPKGAGAG